MSRLIYFYPALFWDVIVRTSQLKFSFKRWILAILVLLIIPLLQVFIAFFRLLDCILFPGFLKIKTPPVFIIGLPRSGTSYLYDVLTEHDHLASIKLYEALLPSLTLIKLIRLIDTLDGIIFHPLRGMVRGLERVMFKGWDTIHPTAFNRKEEDEALFFMTGTSPAINMLSPLPQNQKKWSLLDNAPESVQKNLGKYYVSSMRRLQYLNKDKTLVIKNVFSSGRIEWLSTLFPNASFIFPRRTALKTIPSTISMFTVMYEWLIMENESMKKGYVWWINMLVQLSTKLEFGQASNKSIDAPFKEIVGNTHSMSLQIFDFLDVSDDQSHISKVNDAISAYSEHVSKHKYDINDFGITEEELKDLLLEKKNSQSM